MLATVSPFLYFWKLAQLDALFALWLPARAKYLVLRLDALPVRAVVMVVMHLTMSRWVLW
jgi:hypothetical protein